MANLLQSSQTQATEAPQFYTNYLANLATQGQQASQAAQFAGAQPLQTQAFEQVGTAGKAYQPTLAQAGNVLTKATEATSPLAAGAQYLQQAAGSPAARAAEYMNPYVENAVQSMSDIAMRNLQQNLTPMATAATVGSGQYGSQRGAQVLGQTQRQAMQDLNAEIAKMMSTGYGQALQAGTAQGTLLGQLGQTAGSQAGAGQQNLTSMGRELGTLAGVNQSLSLADINALATLGGQQQTIAQNQQNYPLTKLASLAALLQGQQIPSTVRTQMEMAPVSGLAALASLYASPAGEKAMGGLGDVFNKIKNFTSSMPSITSNITGPDKNMPGADTAITTTPSGSIGGGTSYSGGTGGENDWGQDTTQADTEAP